MTRVGPVESDRRALLHPYRAEPVDNASASAIHSCITGLQGSCGGAHPMPADPLDPPDPLEATPPIVGAGAADADVALTS
ncbi:hypothetical protein [Nocardia australiensis]|uniref:hypothetical protein n=1 Tax=Nocardia australiensis TaxID=2887191 RepID=UPI001D153D4F|nr:hypothetical protein [Nocardia australiensis]